MEENKRCTKCNEVKLVTEFGWRKDGNTYRNECKVCQSSVNKKWRENNQERKRTTNKKWWKRWYSIEANKQKASLASAEWQKANPDKVKKSKNKYRKSEYGKAHEQKWRKQYYVNNKEKSLAANKKWAKDNPEKRKEINTRAGQNPINIEKRRTRDKLYYRENKEKIQKEAKIQRKKHAQRILENNRLYRKNNPDIMKAMSKRATIKNSKNPKKKISACMSTRIKTSLKSGKDGNHWETIIGYTLKDLMLHLESKFIKGMTWKNHGNKGWHIDHIIPVSLWEFTTFKDREFKQCWALCNLQPLWALDNISKGNKV